MLSWFQRRMRPLIHFNHLRQASLGGHRQLDWFKKYKALQSIAHRAILSINIENWCRIIMFRIFQLLMFLKWSHGHDDEEELFNNTQTHIPLTILKFHIISYISIIKHNLKVSENAPKTWKFCVGDEKSRLGEAWEMAGTWHLNVILSNSAKDKTKFSVRGCSCLLATSAALIIAAAGISKRFCFYCCCNFIQKLRQNERQRHNRKRKYQTSKN